MTRQQDMYESDYRQAIKSGMTDTGAHAHAQRLQLHRSRRGIPEPMKRITQYLESNDYTLDGKPNGGEYKVNALQPAQGDGIDVPEHLKAVLYIQWQKGPLVDAEGKEQMPNGLFLETLVEACIRRLTYYQSTEFKSRENAIALTHLETAKLWLGARAARREAEGTLGTHIPDTK
jgi:hypothetical protein